MQRRQLGSVYYLLLPSNVVFEPCLPVTGDQSLAPPLMLPCGSTRMAPAVGRTARRQTTIPLLPSVANYP